MKWIRPRNQKPLVGHQLAFKTIIGFWLFYVIIISLRAAVMDFPNPMELAARRAMVACIGIVVTWLLYLILRGLDRRKLNVRITAAFLLAIPAALLIASVNYYIFTVYDPVSLFDNPDLERQVEKIQAMIGVSPFQHILEDSIRRFFFVVAWALLYLSISYAMEVRETERVAGRFARAAQDAELRSLRYQVNPHFLFNTLNSLSSLVIKGQNDRAEAMIQNLAGFYRTSLSSDPLENVSLAEEVELQERYLDIEALRFPKRLKVSINIPDELSNIIVPALILQPLLENSIKHGVSLSDEPVTISISARKTESHIEICVSDDADSDEYSDDSHNNGIGITNVRDRLEAKYGHSAKFSAGKSPNRGYASTIFLPKVAQNREA